MALFCRILGGISFFAGLAFIPGLKCILLFLLSLILNIQAKKIASLDMMNSYLKDIHEKVCQTREERSSYEKRP